MIDATTAILSETYDLAIGFVQWIEVDAWELFDLDRDPNEMRWARPPGHRRLV
ncbi:MAG TPA: hypothetical protein VMM18_11670 [Gemmatimonadaceae bacterium]|nr:hypothetical protein [Gemmatimonadaceae bacterium]